MGFLDKLLGREKSASEGMHQEKEGKAEDHGAMNEEPAQDAPEQAVEARERDS